MKLIYSLLIQMKALSKFQHDASCMALLMDGSAALGLDLSFVTHVFLMEPIWDKRYIVGFILPSSVGTHLLLFYCSSPIPFLNTTCMEYCLSSEPRCQCTSTAADFWWFKKLKFLFLAMGKKKHASPLMPWACYKHDSIFYSVYKYSLTIWTDA